MKTLKSGDEVRIIAPGKAIEEPWEVLQQACQFLQSYGLVPSYTQHIFADFDSYYDFANSDENRFLDFVEALQSNAAAIWCFRGGYGSDRILQRFNQLNFPVIEPKLFIGFSDVTNLHNYLHRKFGWETLHASVLKQFGLREVETSCVQQTMDVVLGKLLSQEYSLLALNDVAKGAQCSGKIVGGNLTTIQCALGTPWEMLVDGNIVFFEDVGEAPYRVARILQQFLVSGYLAKAKAILLGDFIPEPQQHFELQAFADECSMPVYRFYKVGHGAENLAVPLNVASRIENSKLFIG